MKEKYLECGRIINTHGIKGEVKIEPWCDSPAVFAKLPRVWMKGKQGLTDYRISRASVFKQFVIAGLEGVDSIDKAALLKNVTLYADREDFPVKSGAYFLADLIGLPVFDNVTGKEYGKLREIINRGASDIYVVDTPSGERMMPAVGEFVKKVDPNTGIFVEPIEGMFE